MDETKYLYGAAVIISMSYYMLLSFMISLSILIAEGILALHDPALRALYDLKVGRLICLRINFCSLRRFYRSSCNAIPTSCWRGVSDETSQNEEEQSMVSSTSKLAPHLAIACSIIATDTCVMSSPHMTTLCYPPLSTPTS